MFNQQLSQSQLPPNIAYLASDFPKHTSCAAHSPEQFSDPHLLLEAYRQRARRMVEVAAVQYQHAKHSAGLDDVAAWNGSSVDWTNAAKVSSCTGQRCHYGLFPPQAHCHFVVLRAFIEAIQNADVCPANLAILNALCSLYAVFGIVQCSGEFTLVSNWVHTTGSLCTGILQLFPSCRMDTCLHNRWEWHAHTSTHCWV